MTHDTCGRSSPDAFAYFDPESSCWRTSQDTLLSDSTVCSVTLPKRGSMRNGWLYERPTLARPTGGNGSSALLGTPSAADAMGGHLSRGGTRSHELLLKGQVKALLPTPVAQDDMKSAEAHLAKKDRETITSLTVMTRQYAETGEWANKLLPTPTANIADNGGSQHPDKRRAGNHLPSIQDVAEHELLPTPRASRGASQTETVKLLPTPVASDSANARNSTANRTKTQPSVESGAWSGKGLESLSDLTFRGAFTNPPSDDGNTLSESPRLGQLTIEDA